MSSVTQSEFRRLLTRNIVLPVVAGAVGVLLFVFLIFNILSAHKWVQHTEEVLNSASRITKLTVDMQAGMRGFAITGDDQFLLPYESVKSGIYDQLSKLRQQVGDNANQVQRLDKTRELLARWIDYAETVIAMKRSGQDYVAEVRKRGNATYEIINHEFIAFEDAEKQLLAARQQTAERITFWSVVGYLSFMLLFATIVSLSGRRDLLRLSQNYQSAQQDLQAALKMREDFMSMVAHELRTPLNNLHMEGQLRQMQLDGGMVFSEERLRCMLAQDSRQVKSMIRLISDMDDVSRLQAGRLSINLKPVRLDDLLVQVVSDMAQRAEAAGSQIELIMQKAVTCRCDEIRVEQILTNLLTNALRYGQGKPVSVQLQELEGSVEVVVTDQGIGIPETDQDRIFEKFERANGKDICDGLGMGLYIARQLAEAHGGSLGVTSTPGSGASFKLRLPMV